MGRSRRLSTCCPPTQWNKTFRLHKVTRSKSDIWASALLISIVVATMWSHQVDGMRTRRWLMCVPTIYSCLRCTHTHDYRAFDSSRLRFTVCTASPSTVDRMPNRKLCQHKQVMGAMETRITVSARAAIMLRVFHFASRNETKQLNTVCLCGGRSQRCVYFYRRSADAFQWRTIAVVLDEILSSRQNKRWFV